MPLLLGDRPYPIYKFQRLLEIGKAEFSMQVVFVHHLPLGNVVVKLLQLLAPEWWYTPAAWNALLIGKFFAHSALLKNNVGTAAIGCPAARKGSPHFDAHAPAASTAC